MRPEDYNQKDYRIQEEMGSKSKRYLQMKLVKQVQDKRNEYEVIEGWSEEITIEDQKNGRRAKQKNKKELKDRTRRLQSVSNSIMKYKQKEIRSTSAI